MTLTAISSNLLYIAFFAYLIATFVFGGAVKGNKKGSFDSEQRWGKVAITVTVFGFLANLGYFFTRWAVSGHAPLSNMFEFTTAFGMTLVGGFIILYFLYKTPVLGMVVLPVALLIIAYASMFPNEISPLIPALQTNWLAIHVSTVVIAEGILAISAAVVTMQKGIDGKEDFDQAAGALSQNTDNLSAAVGSVYGDEAGEAFKEIWSSHIGYFVDYVKATGAKDEEAKQKALKELDEYRVEQAAFLDKATEGRLKAADLEGGLKVHITQLLTSFDSYVAGDYDATYSNLRIAIEHMYMVGEGLSGAIVDQYPDKFKNTKVDTPAADLRAGLNRNFSEHAALAILTMQKGIDGAKDFDAAAGALNENTDDLSASIGSVYGSEAAQEFKKIWSSHIGYFVDYVKATGAKDEEARDMAVQELDEYRVEQAAFLDAATEGRLKSKDLEEGLKVHIDQLLLAFNSYNEKDYDKTYPAIREAYGHMYGVGEGTATAIVDQFPDKFQGSPAGMPNTGLGGAAESQSSAGILWSLLGIAAASILGFFALRRRPQQ